MSAEERDPQITPIGRFQEAFTRATGRVCYELIGPQTPTRIINFGIKAYERLLLANPADAVSLSRIARLHIYKAFHTKGYDDREISSMGAVAGEMSSAHDYLERAINLDPDNLNLQMEFAITQMCTARFYAAKITIDRVIEGALEARDAMLAASAYINQTRLYEVASLNRNVLLLAYANATKQLGDLSRALADSTYRAPYVIARRSLLLLRGEVHSQMDEIEGVSIESEVLRPLQVLGRRI
ncbi:MAG: hypothetical protein ABIE03_01540 [Patescibacteria group bacterium]|nr:hypothetical protein [Patescibacteria group bacterium]